MPVASLLNAPEPGASFQPLPAAAAQARNYPLWQKSFTQWLAAERTRGALRHRESGLTSRPGETERDFKIRVQDASRSARDKAVAAVSAEVCGKAGDARREAPQGGGVGWTRERAGNAAEAADCALGWGDARRRSVRPQDVSRRHARASDDGCPGRQADHEGIVDVQRATDTAEAVRARQQQLEDQIREETKTIAAAFEQPVDFEHVTLLPKRGQVTVQLLALGWDPE